MSIISSMALAMRCLFRGEYRWGRVPPKYCFCITVAEDLWPLTVAILILVSSPDCIIQMCCRVFASGSNLRYKGGEDRDEGGAVVGGTRELWAVRKFSCGLEGFPRSGIFDRKSALLKVMRVSSAHFVVCGHPWKEVQVRRCAPKVMSNRFQIRSFRVFDLFASILRFPGVGTRSEF